MSSNKAEKTEKSKEDDLAASISKSMTVDTLKNALTQNKIVYSAAKKKADFVDLYISNGLHNKVEAVAEKAEAVAEKAEAVAEKAEAVAEKAEAVAEKAEAVAEKEELIMSIAIMGHGCEDLLTPWTPDQPISLYFRNNVRVYSKSCVPDVNSIGNIYQNEDIIKDVQRRFSNVPKGETSAIVKAYADEVRDDYIRDVGFSKLSKAPISLTRGFDKLSDITNLARVSNLSAFLSNKNFSFYMDSEKERVNSIMRPVYNTLGIQLVDIRIKKTAVDGSVSYEQIFNPTDVKYIRFDLTNLNLIYKSGLTYILKEILKRKDLVKPALEIFGFGKKDRILNLSLEQIYEFFQLLGVKYANIMDYTCRACSVGRIPQGLSDRIYSVEQRYSVKPVAFGKRSRTLKGKRSSTLKGKQSKGKKSKGNQSKGKYKTLKHK
jgi:hypothetical protein